MSAHPRRDAAARAGTAARAAPYVAQGLLAPLDPERLRYDVTFHMVVARSGRGNPLVEAFLEDLERAHHTPDTPA